MCVDTDDEADDSIPMTKCRPVRTPPRVQNPRFAGLFHTTVGASIRLTKIAIEMSVVERGPRGNVILHIRYQILILFIIQRFNVTGPDRSRPRRGRGHVDLSWSFYYTVPMITLQRMEPGGWRFLPAAQHRRELGLPFHLTRRRRRHSVAGWSPFPHNAVPSRSILGLLGRGQERLAHTLII